MLRRTLVILTVLMMSMATQVYALGLGTVTVESALNQPLRVRIELLQLGDTRLEDVVVQMASTDDFQRFDVERVGFLSNIRFRLEATDSGNFAVLSSNQVVREPYLSLILETRWPSGRLLSEHTILLDLPVFDDQQASPNLRQPISPVLQAPSSAGQSQPFAQPSPSSSSASDAPQRTVEREANNDQSPLAEQADLAPESIGGNDTAEAIAPEEIETTEPEVAPQDEVAEEQQETSEAAEELTAQADDAAVVEEQTSEQEAEAVADAIADTASAETAVDASAEPEAVTETIETTSSDTLSDIALQARPNDSVSMQQTMIAIQQENPEAFGDSNINNLRSGEVLRIPSLAEIQAVDPREAIDEVNRQNQQAAAAADVEPLAAPSTVDANQADAPQGQLSVVNSDDTAVDASSASSELDQAEDSDLNTRIVELETQLAVQQEEADRARIEREDLQQRMRELEEQITAAAEIIRLQDLQLAQLQESLTQAAAEAAEAAASNAAVNSELATPLYQQPTSMLDNVLRILTGNILLLGGAVVLLIIILVAFMLRRNKASKFEDDDELDEIAGNEYESAADTEENLEDEQRSPDTSAAELQDFDETDLDGELDEFIEVSDELVEDVAARSNDGTEFDVVGTAGRFADEGQLDRAASLLRTALSDNADNIELRWALVEVLCDQRDVAAFEEQADILSADGDVDTASKLQNLRNRIHSDDVDDVEDEHANTLIETQAAASEQQEITETSSFLDDLGIDLDSFDSYDESDSDDSGSAQSDAVESETKPEEPSSLDSFEDEEAGLTFDLSSDSLDDEAVAGDDILATEGESGLAVETDAQLDDSDSTDDSDLDTFEFSLDEDDEVQEQEAEEKLDVESVSFDASDIPSIAEEDEPASAEPDENAVDFSFDKDEIAAAPDAELDQELDEGLESFEFSASEPIIESAGESAEDAAESQSGEEDIEWGIENLDDSAEGEGVEAVVAEASEDKDEVDEFDFDLDEFEIDDDEVTAQESPESSKDDTQILVGIDMDEEDNLDFLTVDEADLEMGGEIDEVELMSDDETATKLELAYAYQKMGDVDGAREILQEVVNEGTEEQVAEAKKLMETLSNSPD